MLFKIISLLYYRLIYDVNYGMPALEMKRNA